MTKKIITFIILLAAFIACYGVAQTGHPRAIFVIVGILIFCAIVIKKMFNGTDKES